MIFKHTPIEARALWTAALRSGAYEQGQGALCTRRMSNPTITEWCCLGVACDLFQKHEDPTSPIEWKHGNTAAFGPTHETAFLPPIVQQWLGLRTNNGAHTHPTVPHNISLSELNDDEASYDDDNSDETISPPSTFIDIADLIDSNPPNLTY